MGQTGLFLLLGTHDWLRPTPRHPVELAELDDLIGAVVSVFTENSATALAWFTSALRHTPGKWFVVKILDRVSPVPRTLFDPLLLASSSEPNPSANHDFIVPWIRTFGQKAVVERLNVIARGIEGGDEGGLERAIYWANRYLGK